MLDEPDSGVDIDSLRILARVLEELLSKSKGILLISHTLSFLEELVTRGVVTRIGIWLTEA